MKKKKIFFNGMECYTFYVTSIKNGSVECEKFIFKNIKRELILSY